MKTNQVMQFCDNGIEYKVIKYYGEINPYRIYKCFYAPDRYGYLTKHRKMIVKYANLNSCFWWFVQNNLGN